MYTSTTENYVKHLYLLQQRLGEGMVPTGKLAESLGVTHGTATPMVKSLAESGLVDYESYGGARLTDKGSRLALDVLRRHRLVELFLVKVLGLDWDEVHNEAEVLEHVISERVLRRIDELLGHPTVDPHGDPIPDATGRIVKRQMRGLDECEAGEKVQVARVANQDSDFLRYAEQKGLTPGAVLAVVERDPLADSVTIRPGEGRELVVSTTVARKILVSEPAGT